VGQRRQRAVLVGRQEQTGLEEDLETVADAENQLLLVAEAAEGVLQEGHELGRQDLAGGDVVAVGEAARDGEDLVAVEQRRLFAEAVDVDSLSLCARLFEGEKCFLVTVCAGGAEDQGSWGGHKESVKRPEKRLTRGGRADQNASVVE
jgi:hypothetical protein